MIFKRFENIKYIAERDLLYRIEDSSSFFKCVGIEEKKTTYLMTLFNIKIRYIDSFDIKYLELIHSGTDFKLSGYFFSLYRYLLMRKI